MELEITTTIFLTTFAIAMILGAVVHKTNFCTMGAVSDWVNMGETGRFRAWLLAIAVALTGVLTMEALGVAGFDQTLPPYRSANFMWIRYLLGGLMFGVGMTLGSGCGNKTLIRVGGGNLKSVVVLLVIGIWAYLMTKTNLYGYLFYSWMQPISIDLAARDIPSQELSALLAAAVGATSSMKLHLMVGGAIALALWIYALRSTQLRGSLDNLLGGSVVGLAVVGGWWVTAGPLGAEWGEYAEFLDNPPVGVGAQSFTFINPAGETLFYLADPGRTELITFGIVALTGVIAGSFLYALATRRLRLEWFASWRDFFNHVLGGTLMGVGGVLAMGCTIGQGVTGVSTLALGSILAFGAIVLGCALTMKMQYYRMLYEGEAGLISTLTTSLADLRLLPDSLRRHERA